MIRSHVRINNLSGVSTSLRGRSYCSEPLSRVLKGSTGSSTSGSEGFDIVLVPPAFTIWGCFIYHFDFLQLRTKYVKRKAEKKAQELLGRLDREKFKSEDAYMEMLEREVNALKENLSERDPDVFDLMICEREMAVLKEKIKTRDPVQPGQRKQPTPGSQSTPRWLS